MNQQNSDAQRNDEPIAPDVPDFNMIRPVGSGGFGQVWLAANRTTGQLRAVKVIPLHHAGHTDPAAREISSLTRLEANLRCRHPNLLPIHHVGKTARHLFYVMDLADDLSGGPASDRPDYQPATLQTRLHDAEGDSPIFAAKYDCQNKDVVGAAKIGTVPGPLPPEVCLDYARQLLAGLAALHAAGMVHRDVKPANCLFVGGQLKLADFGLLTEAHPLVSRVGTQKYMPPDGRMDMRADVYAVGLVIYEIISGLPVDDFPRLGRQLRPIIGNPILTSLLRLVLRACEREPEKRFADARAMLAELSMPVQTMPRLPRRRMLAAASPVIVLIAAGMSAWLLAPSRVDVSFVTEPYEARIYLDDVLLVDSEGSAYMTPCTADDLMASAHRVAFECEGLPRWDAGRYDFARTQQIVSRRPK
jgi:eukaryotic-like serine/threonine-protein kinase